MVNSTSDATKYAFFKERLRKAGVIEDLFEMFEVYLRSQGLQARDGQIIDATPDPVPKLPRDTITALCCEARQQCGQGVPWGTIDGSVGSGDCSSDPQEFAEKPPKKSRFSLLRADRAPCGLDFRMSTSQEA